MSPKYRTIGLRVLIAVALSSVALSCKQYEYASPSPGIVEVRLRAKNNRTDIIPFAGGDSSYLQLILSSMNFLQGEARLPVYADLHAIRRPPNGDNYNALNLLARDSNMIIGQAYAPPGTYSGLEFTMDWGPSIFLVTGYYVSSIGVRDPNPPPPTYNRIEPLSIQVNEARLTRVTLTVDLDVSLQRIEEWFELHPRYYVSSVQNF